MWALVFAVVLPVAGLFVWSIARPPQPSRWEVRSAQLHTMGLDDLLADGWEPFGVARHEPDDVVLLRRRTSMPRKPMSPEDAARFMEAQGE